MTKEQSKKAAQHIFLLVIDIAIGFLEDSKEPVTVPNIIKDCLDTAGSPMHMALITKKVVSNMGLDKEFMLDAIDTARDLASKAGKEMPDELKKAISETEKELRPKSGMEDKFSDLLKDIPSDIINSFSEDFKNDLLNKNKGL